MKFDLLQRAMPLLFAATLSACAGGRAVVNVNTPPTSAQANPTPATAVPANAVPATAHAFVKLTVRDVRHFEAAPHNPSVPSLKDSADIANPAVTARAVARQRDHFGLANGDVVLPADKTVAEMVQAGAQKALQDKGYTVIDAAAPQYTSARPLDIEIDELWGWYTPGVFMVKGTTAFKARLKLSGDSIVGPGGAAVSSDSATESHTAPDARRWNNIVQSGFDDIDTQIAGKIKPAAP